MHFSPCLDEDNKKNHNKIGAKMKTVEAKCRKLKARKSTVYIDHARGRAVAKQWKVLDEK